MREILTLRATIVLATALAWTSSACTDNDDDTADSGVADVGGQLPFDGSACFPSGFSAALTNAPVSCTCD